MRTQILGFTAAGVLLFGGIAQVQQTWAQAQQTWKVQTSMQAGEFY